MHTATLKGKEYDRRLAHTQLEKVLYLVKWQPIFLRCCGAFCFACIFCGFSNVHPLLSSSWQAGSLVVPACGLMPQSISHWPHVSGGLSLLCHRGALQAVGHPTLCPHHGESHRYCFALTPKKQHRKHNGKNKLICARWLPLCFL